MAIAIADLPFLAGHSKFIERVAQLHDAITFDPLVAILSGGNRNKSAWAELLEESFAALEQVGHDVAQAKDAGAAALATLHRDTYFQASRDLDATLLRIGRRLLAAGPSDEPAFGGYVGFVGYGRRQTGVQPERIPATHWEVGQVDWSENRLLVEGECQWRGIRILDLIDVPQPDRQMIGEFSSGSVEIEEAAMLREAPPPLSDIEFHRFMKAHTDKMQPGDPGLAESELVAAAAGKFGALSSRARVRRWMRSHLPYAKRYQRGRKPRR